MALLSTQAVDEGAWLDGDELVMSLGGEERRIPRASLKIAGTGQRRRTRSRRGWPRAPSASTTSTCRSPSARSPDCRTAWCSCASSTASRWINDSKGTNVDATLKSLEGFDGSSVILILGGKDKAGEFERMRDLVKSKARTVLTIGKAADRIAEALQGTSEIVAADDMPTPSQWARENARAGDTVLLSPACASFDQYRNFEHRGEHFEELVRAL